MNVWNSVFSENGTSPKSYWSALLAGFSAGLMLVVGMPGFVGLWPLLFVALVPLLVAVLYLPVKKSIFMGLFCGLVYHLFSLYWIVIVLERYGHFPLWLSCLALLCLALYMSMYLAAFTGTLSFLAGRSWHRERSVSALVWIAPFLWVGLDWLRSHLFTGFPWMDLGYGLYNQPRLIQMADLGGHYLVTFTLVLGNVLLVALVDRQRKSVRWNLKVERRSLFYALSLLLFLFGYSAQRYQILQPVEERSFFTRIAVIQGNIAQYDTWSPALKEEVLQKYMQLSEKAVGTMDIELVVWPETAVPFYPQQSSVLAAELRRFVQDNNFWLLAGAPYYMPPPAEGEHKPQELNKGTSQKTSDWPDYTFYNGALLFNSQGQTVARYAKEHLVPFGEYVPLRDFLFFLKPLVEAAGAFSPGTDARPLQMGPLAMGMLICYESVFPDLARERVRQGANLLINITNVAWYGHSIAPEQDLAMSVFRAVENRRSLVRSANTGISGFITPRGELVSQTDIFTEAGIAARVSLLHDQSVFSRWGYGFGLACFCVSFVQLLFRPRLTGEK